MCSLVISNFFVLSYSTSTSKVLVFNIYLISVDFSVIFQGVTVEKGAVVNYSIIMPGTVIKSGAVVEYAIIGSDSVIESGAVIGKSPESAATDEKWGIAVVGNNVTVSEGTVVTPKQIVGENI